VKIKHQNKITGGNRDGNEFRGGLTTGWCGQEGATPPGGEEPPGSVSNSFSSRDFSYLIKIIEILIEKFNSNLF
jgi:hypothetical protein